jgi:hypothetical protein
LNGLVFDNLFSNIEISQANVVVQFRQYGKGSSPRDNPACDSMNVICNNKGRMAAANSFVATRLWAEVDMEIGRSHCGNDMHNFNALYFPGVGACERLWWLYPCSSPWELPTRTNDRRRLGNVVIMKSSQSANLAGNKGGRGQSTLEESW